MPSRWCGWFVGVARVVVVDALELAAARRRRHARGSRAGHRERLRRHRLRAPVGGQRQPDAGLELLDRRGERVQLAGLAAGTSVRMRARSPRMKSTTLSCCASLAAATRRIPVGGQDAAEHAVVDVQRLRSRGTAAGARPCGPPRWMVWRQRRPIRQHARRDLVAVGADVGGQRQILEGGLAGRRRVVAAQERRLVQEDLIDRSPAGARGPACRSAPASARRS